MKHTTTLLILAVCLLSFLAAPNTQANDDMVDAQYDQNTALKSIATSLSASTQDSQEIRQLKESLIQERNQNTATVDQLRQTANADRLRFDQLLQHYESQLQDRRAPSDPFAVGVGRSSTQLNPRLPLFGSEEFDPEQDSIEFFLLTVPDPRVPRLKREFDLVTSAAFQALAYPGAKHLRQDFVINNYFYPWNLDAPQSSSSNWLSTNNIQKSECAILRKYSGKYPTADCTEFLNDEYNRVVDQCVTMLANSISSNTNKDEGKKAADEAQTNKITPAAARQKKVKECVSRAEFAQDLLKDKLESSKPKSFSAHAAINNFFQLLTGSPPEFGIVIFRSDTFRAGKKQDSRYAYRVLYLVAERPSAGISVPALTEAMANMLVQPPVDTSPPKLTIIGPLYSGSVAPLVTAIQVFDSSINQLLHSVDKIRGCSRTERKCSESRHQTRKSIKLDNYLSKVVSPSASSETNSTSDNLFEGMDPITFLSTKDNKRWKSLKTHVAKENTICLVENSAYGRGFPCPEEQTVYFPPNLWEVRAAAPTNQAANSSLPDFGSIINGSRELKIDVDLGSEYPASFARYTTSRTTELNLLATLNHLTGKVASSRLLSNYKNAGNILIISTDVRDQLFLAEFLAREVPNKQLLFANGDRLLAHPEYIDATRGSIIAMDALSSSHIFGSPPQFFSTETAAMVFKSIIHAGNENFVNKQLRLNVVTRDGIKILPNDNSQLYIFLSGFSFLVLTLLVLFVPWQSAVRQIPVKIIFALKPISGEMIFVGLTALFAVVLLAYGIGRNPGTASIFWINIALVSITAYLSLRLAKAVGSIPLVGGFQLINLGVTSLLVVLNTVGSVTVDGVDPRTTFSISYLMFTTSMLIFILGWVQLHSDSKVCFDQARSRERRHRIAMGTIIIGALVVAASLAAILDGTHPYDNLADSKPIFKQALTYGNWLSFVVAATTIFALIHYWLTRRLALRLFTLERNCASAIPMAHMRGSNQLVPSYTKTVEAKREINAGHKFLLFAAPIFVNLLEFDEMKAQERIQINTSSLVSFFSLNLLLTLLYPVITILIIFISPVSHQSIWVVTNLLLLIFFAIAGVQKTLQLDRLPNLRGILGLPMKGTSAISSYLGYIFVPLIIVVLGLMIALVPGVRAWTEGWLPSIIQLYM